MADWDDDSPRLQANLAKLLDRIVREAPRRRQIRVADALRWQREVMAGLDVPDRLLVGRFRGSHGLEHVWVQIGRAYGVPPGEVAAALGGFQARLRRIVGALDSRYPFVDSLDEDGVAAVLDLCAWVHAEWVRIHPLANGNGRTARLWANSLLVRYGLPPVIRLRPRPGGAYGAAGAAAMRGDDRPTRAVFARMLYDFAARSEGAESEPGR